MIQAIYKKVCSQDEARCIQPQGLWITSTYVLYEELRLTIIVINNYDTMIYNILRKKLIIRKDYCGDVNVVN